MEIKIKNRTLVITLLILSSMLLAIPRTMNYQGKLTDTDGVGINDDLDMVFRIYDTASGGIPLWSESHTGVEGVSVMKGMFDVELGSLNPIDLDFSDDYWLELVIEGEVISPSAFARVKVKTSGDLGDIFHTDKPDIKGSYPLHFPTQK